MNPATNPGKRLDALTPCVQLLIIEVRELQATVRRLEEELNRMKDKEIEEVHVVKRGAA